GRRSCQGPATPDSVSRDGEMVDVPASPVTQLPHQRLPRSAGNRARRVRVLRESFSRYFGQPTSRKQSQAGPRPYLASENGDLTSLARRLLSQFPTRISQDALT